MGTAPGWKGRGGGAAASVGTGTKEEDMVGVDEVVISSGVGRKISFRGSGGEFDSAAVLKSPTAG